MKNISQDMKRATQQERIEICREVDSINRRDIRPEHAISLKLANDYKHIPEVLQIWGRKLYENRHHNAGVLFMKSAVDNAHYDKKPAMLYKNAERIFGEFGLKEEREFALRLACEKLPEDIKFKAQYAKFLLDDKRPQTAISVLKPLHESGRGSVVTTNTLGNAYIHAGEYAGAISVLKPLYESGCGNEMTTNTLGNVLVMVKNRPVFDTLKPDITPDSLRDYLDAKLYYLEGEAQQAVKVLKPYIQDGAHMNHLSLFVSCLGEDSPWYELLKTRFSQEEYDYVLECVAEWQDNPVRTERSIVPLSNGADIYEYGALPINHQEREKLGIKGLPVASTNWGWDKGQQGPL